MNQNHELTHPNGVKIELPLLVPSYSSKGFTLFEESGKTKSELRTAISIAKEILVESVLVSAYDLYYEHFDKPEDFISTGITFIDSGGYETSSSFDFSETRRAHNGHKEWNINYLSEVLNKWDHQRFSSIVVNFDEETNRISLIDQINEAKDFFSNFDNCLRDFLIKPETTAEKYIQMKSILENVDKLDSFDIIGITEKELGYSILQRMHRIRKIKSELENNGNFAPIHIFGSLDPITTILYFLAGAEIFDGLTWLKYSYFNGIAMYTHNLCPLNKDIEINTHDNQVKAKAIYDNVYYLDRLKNLMIKFRNSDYDFSIFDQLGYSGLGKMIEHNFNIFQNRKEKV